MFVHHRLLLSAGQIILADARCLAGKVAIGQMGEPLHSRFDVARGLLPRHPVSRARSGSA